MRERGRETGEGGGVAFDCIHTLAHTLRPRVGYPVCSDNGISIELIVLKVGHYRTL
jgi:hypothetical protein